MIPVEAVEEVARQLAEMAEREERLLAEGLPYSDDRVTAVAHSKAWRTAARLVLKCAESEVKDAKAALIDELLAEGWQMPEKPYIDDRAIL